MLRKKYLWLATLLWPMFSNAAPLPGTAKVTFEFELPAVETSVYARPYVAVWIEDGQRKPIKTIQLWVGKDEWLKDLRSWWRKVGRYDSALVDAVSSATRPIGQYRFMWDGNDELGNKVEQGVYTLHIEVVREHGGRNYLRQKVSLTKNDAFYHLAPTEETGQIKINYLVN